MASGTAPDSIAAASFAPLSAQRLLVFGGIALIIAGMLFGDIFAVFVLHQNAAQTGAALLQASAAAAARNASAVQDLFARIGGLLEDHGTKVDAHAHMVDAGYLALLLALVQPWVDFSERRRKLLAAVFVAAGTLLPVGIFLIHYVGLAHSPLPLIGWASVLADSAGAVMIAVTAAEAFGLARWFRARGSGRARAEVPADAPDSRESSACARMLRAGGAALVLAGFVYGAWYSAVDLYRHEARERQILQALVDDSLADNAAGAQQSVNDFGMLQADKAVKIAAHSHLIEFGVLALLLSFVQPYVYLSERWRRRWVLLLLAGSLILPLFVRLELNLGLAAGGIADGGGLMVVVALCGMLAGVLRYSGREQGEARA